MGWKGIGLAIAVIVLVGAISCAAQTPGTPEQPSAAAKSPPDLKIFEAATGMANALTSWAFIMIGGSILAILGTGYYRPAALWVRCAYFAFVPAWFFLSWSVYAGTRVQGVYLAALFSRAPKVDVLKQTLNNDAIAQVDRMEMGLLCFGVWLALYLFWWVFNTEDKKEVSK